MLLGGHASAQATCGELRLHAAWKDCAYATQVALAQVLHLGMGAWLHL